MVYLVRKESQVPKDLEVSLVLLESLVHLVCLDYLD